MSRTMNLRALAMAFLATATCLFLVCFAAVAHAAHGRETWSAEEVALISSMRLSIQSRTADPSNDYEGSAGAIALGRALFHDPGFSTNGKVSCATCHVAESQFADALPRGQGIGTGKRRTMPVMGAAESPFLFWDGRKDSLWSQALGPLEDSLEHGSNRVSIARRIASQYAGDYEKVFGKLPDLQSLPVAASPVGSLSEREAWTRMTESSHAQINRIYANMGKAIAAYERMIEYGESRFDHYANAVVSGNEAGQRILSTQEVRGLRVFITRGQCATCHSGPLLTDHAFHNTAVRATPASPDKGRFEGVKKLLGDEFNCLGPYSDARPEQCVELQFLASDDSAQMGSFRTPGLRNVALRPPYMHAGQFTSLEQVVRHYMRAPVATVGRSEITARSTRDANRIVIQLGEPDVADLVAFLSTLTGPVNQRGQ
jgi:cytochrome c peroxidase